jgi:hypothetical protein
MGFLDDGGDEPVDGLMYQNYPVKNCSILSMDFTQINQPTTQIQVYTTRLQCRRKLKVGQCGLQYIGEPVLCRFGLSRWTKSIELESVSVVSISPPR